MSHTIIPNWLQRRAISHPHKTALVAEGRSYSFSQLLDEAAAQAARLSSLGVKAGSRVALLCRNSADLVAVLHAIFLVQAVAVPINHRLTPAEARAQLSTADVKLLIADAPLHDLAAEVARETDGVKVVGLQSGRRGDARLLGNEWLAPVTHGHDDPQLILFTSGTTGTSKGAIITYGNTWSNAMGSLLNLPVGPDDRWLACLPLFHIGGLAILMRSVIYGMTAVVHERFDAARVNEAIDTGEVSIVSLVATMLDRIVEERGGRPFPPTLRYILLGGGPVPEPLLARSLALNAPIVQSYGLTECSSQVATLPPDKITEKAGSSGLPLMGVELKVEAPPGDVGEIWVRGPLVSPGYLHEPLHAHVDEEGWFRTGDLGYLDADGYLYVVSRRTDLIISGGENVYPAEIERVLAIHPTVKEVAVVGAPDDRWGEVPVAFILPAPGCSLDIADLTALCEERLAKYKRPVAFYAVNELPRNASGKVLRTVLRERAYTAFSKSAEPKKASGKESTP